MRTQLPSLWTAVALLALASGCHDSSGGGAKSFDATVTNQIQNHTTEDAEPIEIGGTVFAFPSDEHAFDDLLPADTGAVVPQ